MKRRRILIEISEDQYQVLARHIPFGYKKTIYSLIITKLCTALETNANALINNVIIGKYPIFSEPTE